jgi:hypothetical protein
VLVYPVPVPVLVYPVPVPVLLEVDFRGETMRKTVQFVGGQLRLSLKEKEYSMLNINGAHAVLKRDCRRIRENDHGRAR